MEGSIRISVKGTWRGRNRRTASTSNLEQDGDLNCATVSQFYLGLNIVTVFKAFCVEALPVHFSGPRVRGEKVSENP